MILKGGVWNNEKEREKTERRYSEDKYVVLMGYILRKRMREKIKEKANKRGHIIEKIF